MTRIKWQLLSSFIYFYPKCAYGPYRKFNPVKNGVYNLVEVSFLICKR